MCYLFFFFWKWSKALFIFPSRISKRFLPLSHPPASCLRPICPQMNLLWTQFLLQKTTSVSRHCLISILLYFLHVRRLKLRWQILRYSFWSSRNVCFSSAPWPTCGAWEQNPQHVAGFCSSLGFASVSALIETRLPERWFIHLWVFGLKWRSGLMTGNTGPSDSTHCTTLSGCVARLWRLVSVTRFSVFFSPPFLFFYNGPQPSVILLSQQITSPFTAQGAGWLVTGLNEHNDQPLRGSHSLFFPKKTAPSHQG